MLVVPEIQSVGLPPEKHADRVVLEMMRLLAAGRQVTWPRIKEAFMQASDGNPKAQARMLEKMSAASGPFMMSAHLEAGKRGRYRVCWLDAAVWNPEIGDFVWPGDMNIPEMPWLAFVVFELTSKGGHRYDTKSSASLFLTHHALSRLTQRCGARTVYEVWNAACKIAEAYFNRTEVGVRPLRVLLPDGMGTVVCALRSSDKDKGDVAVATLWREGEIPDEAQ
jgi:hypothetical protein